MKAIGVLALALGLSVCCMLSLQIPGLTAPIEVRIRKVLDNGEDGKRKCILVMGEGYAKSDAEKYYADVDRIVLRGLLGNEVYRANSKGFNVYRMAMWSKDSGLTHTSSGPRKDTVFGISVIDKRPGDPPGYYEYPVPIKEAIGRFSNCEGLVPKSDICIVIINDDKDGGTTYGEHWIVISRGLDWETLCHEVGHALGHLFDEYDDGLVYKGPDYNFLNSTTLTDRTKIAWAGHLLLGVPVPTPEHSKKNPANLVGVYEGGATYAIGRYRPGLTCRMRQHWNQTFCQVCQDLIGQLLNEWQPVPKPLPYQEQLPSGFDFTKGGFMNFGFKLDQDGKIGSFGISKLKQITGGLTLNNNYPIGDHIIESYDEKKRNVVQFGGNPFIERQAPVKNKCGEKVRGMKQGSMFFNLPYKSMDDCIKSGLGVRVYKINEAMSSKNTVERTGFSGSANSLFPVVNPPVPPPVKPGPGAAEGPVKGKEKVVKIDLVRNTLTSPMTINEQKLQQMIAEMKATLVIDVKPEVLADAMKKFKQPGEFVGKMEK